MFLAILSALGASPFSSAVEKNKTTSDKMTDLMSSNKKTSTKNSHDSNFINKFKEKFSGLSKAKKISLATLLPVGAAIVVGGVIYVVKKVNSKKTLEPIHAMDQSTKQKLLKKEIYAGTQKLNTKTKLKNAKDKLEDYGKFLKSNEQDPVFENSYLKTLLNNYIYDGQEYTHPKLEPQKVFSVRLVMRLCMAGVDWEENVSENGWTIFKGKEQNVNKNLILKDDFSQILFFDTNVSTPKFYFGNSNSSEGPQTLGIYYINEEE